MGKHSVWNERDGKVDMVPPLQGESVLRNLGVCAVPPKVETRCMVEVALAELKGYEVIEIAKTRNPPFEDTVLTWTYV